MSTPALFQLLAALPKPDQVIFLDVTPQCSYERQSQHTAYETNGSTSEDYIHFQTLVRANLLECVHETQYIVVYAHQPVDDVYAIVRVSCCDLSYI